MDRIFMYLWMSDHCVAAIATAATIANKAATPSSFIETLRWKPTAGVVGGKRMPKARAA
jgi:hypothetical protein